MKNNFCQLTILIVVVTLGLCMACTKSPGKTEKTKQEIICEAVCKVDEHFRELGIKHLYFENLLEYQFSDASALVHDLESGVFDFTFFGQRLLELENFGEAALKLSTSLKCIDLVTEGYDVNQKRPQSIKNITQIRTGVSTGRILQLEAFSRISSNMGLVLVSARSFKVMYSPEGKAEFGPPSLGEERFFVVVRMEPDGNLQTTLYKYRILA